MPCRVAATLTLLSFSLATLTGCHDVPRQSYAERHREPTTGSLLPSETDNLAPGTAPGVETRNLQGGGGH